MKMHKIAYLGIWAAISAGCSIINAPEELITVDEGDGDGGDGDGDMGGSSGDGDGDTGGTPGDGDGDTGGTPGDGDGDTGGTPGDGDGDMFMPMPPTTGLIVVAGTETESGDRVLVTLNAQNGSERNRENLQAVSVAYDEAPGRFAWFVFSSGQVVPGNNTRASLEVRFYDDANDEWVAVSSASSLPPPLLRGGQGPIMGPAGPFRPVVLNGRLAYISQVVEGTPVPAITVLDTSDLTDIRVLDSIPIPMDEQVVGLVGRRGTSLMPNAEGGSLSLMVRRDCAGGTDPVCDLVARPMAVSNTIDALTDEVFGQVQGVPAFASTPVLPGDNQSLGAYALAFNPNTGDPRWWRFDPADPASRGAASSLGALTTSAFSAFAVYECLDAGVTGDEMASDLWAVHLNTATVAPATPSFGDRAQDLQVEPFRNNILALRSPGADFASVRAFQIERLAVVPEEILLTERLSFSAPDDFDPISMAVRLPAVPECD